MSHRALQRVVVRMLYDADFALMATSSSRDWLGSEELSERELGWLEQSDPRAWSLDPMRRTRTLSALLDEYPVSLAIALTKGHRFGLFDRFFGSESFHHAMMTRGSLAVAFGQYLQGTLVDIPIVRIERAIAEVRRAPTLASSVHPSAASLVQCSPSVRLVQLPSQCFEAYATWVEAQRPLGGDLESILTGTWSAPTLPRLGSGTEWVLVEPAQDGAAAAPVPDGLATLLEGAQTPCSVAELVGRVADEGVEPEEAIEIVAELIGDGLLSPLLST